MINNLDDIFLWWLAFFVLGLAFLPVAGRIFARFFDRGYLFAKVLGLAVTAYGVWLGASLKIIPFTRPTIFAFIILAGCASFLRGHVFSWLRKKRHGLEDDAMPPGKLSFLRDKNLLKVFCLEEVLFTVGLIAWSCVRGFQPDISGLEKFMDFGFVNSILRASYFPPPDMWFAGRPINYYYFGHYIAAFLTKLTHIPPAITYNLMIATVFAFTFSLVFSLGANLIYLLGLARLRSALIAGVISAALVALGGNLHAFIYVHALPAAHRLGIYHGPLKPFYWYPDATRYIGYDPPTNDKTIHEFPLYSFVVADLHGHVSDIPFVLTLLALLLVLFLRPPGPDRINRTLLGESLLAGFFLSMFYMTNALDLPIYLVVAALVFAYRNFLRRRFSLRFVVETAAQVLTMATAAVLFALPFFLHFENFAKGAGWAPARSPVHQLLVLWGYQLLFVLLFWLTLVWIWLSSRRRASVAPPPVKKTAHRSAVQNPKPNIENTLPRIMPSDRFILILTLAAVGLLAAPEVVYLRDIYGQTYARANTMFKLTYQAFILLGLIAGFTALRILLLQHRRFRRGLLAGAFAFIFALPLAYSVYAINGYYGIRTVDTRGHAHYASSKGLDGLNFLSRLHPDDLEAIGWLNNHVAGQPVILEANGDSYTDYGRISMATGLPTVLGWYVHEWLWRSGQGMGVPASMPPRARDVATIYESPNEAIVRNLLRKYQIRYLVLGDLERTKFKKLKEGTLLKLGHVAFHSPHTQILSFQN